MSDATGEDGSGEDLVITPGGPRPRNRVHQMGPGETVRFDADGKAVIVPKGEDAEMKCAGTELASSDDDEGE